MKKYIMMVIAAVMVLSLTACGSGNGETEVDVNLENPWTEVGSASEAAEGAGVGYFIVPEDSDDYQGGHISFSSFRYMEEIAEAEGGIGAAELVVRKGLNQNTEDVSGDYTEYSKNWTVQTDDWTVSCFGNEEGKTMKAIWCSDNFSYSIMVRGQGDLYDTYGLTDEDIQALVSVIQ